MWNFAVFSTRLAGVWVIRYCVTAVLAPFEKKVKIQISPEQKLQTVYQNVVSCLYVERIDTKNSFLTKVDLDIYARGKPASSKKLHHTQPGQ